MIHNAEVADKQLTCNAILERTGQKLGYRGEIDIFDTVVDARLKSNGSLKLGDWAFRHQRIQDT